MIATVWTDDRIERLRTLWLEGRTADVISKDLGCGISRSAVLGKVYRLGLSAGRTAKTPRISVSKKRLARRPEAPALIRETPPLSPTEPKCGSQTILSVDRGDCRWPLGDPAQPGFSLCGCPVTRGSFCAAHAKIAYRPRPETSQSLERLARLA